MSDIQISEGNITITLPDRTFSRQQICDVLQKLMDDNDADECGFKEQEPAHFVGYANAILDMGRALGVSFYGETNPETCETINRAKVDY